MASKSSIIEEEQRAYIKIRSLLKGSQNRNILNDLVEDCRDQALAYSTVRRWAQLFREGRESVEDEPRTGRRNLLQVICQLSQFMNFYEVIPAVLLRRFLNILRSHWEVFIIYRILKEDLGVRKICARWVPYSLSEAQMKNRVECCQNSIYNMKMRCKETTRDSNHRRNLDLILSA